MNSSEELFKLVKSLNKSEKRYFKLFAGQHSVSGVNNYITLFEAMDKLEKFDDGRLRTKLKNESIQRNLSSIKFQLSQLILKSLRAYHTGRSVDSELREYLEHIEILHNRGLYEQCRKTIAKATGLAEQHEKFTYLTEILTWERRISYILRSKDIFQETENSLAARNDCMEKLWKQWRYTILFERIYALNSINHRVRTETESRQMHDIIGHKLMQEVHSTDSFRSQVCYYRIRSYFANITGNRQNTLTYHEKLIDLWQQHPHFIKDNTDDYKSDLMNLLNSLILTERWKEMDAVIEQIKSLPPVSLQSEIVTFESLTIIELIYYLNLADFGRGRKLIAEIESKLERYGDNLRQSAIIAMYHNVTIFLFFSGDYAEALSWLENILTLKGVEQRQDIQDFARILQLIIHFELRNYDILEYLHRSTYRYLKKGQKLQTVETTILNHIKKAGVFTNEHDLHKTFKQLKNDIESIVAHEDFIEPVGITEISFWLESKIQGVALQDLLKRKVQERETPALG